MDEVEEIKSRLEIAEVVGGYLQLKQAGRNLKAPCPFHQEKSASFMVSPEKGIYHCFGCGEGGDIYKFVMKMEGLDFRGALELLARRAGVELKSRGGAPKQSNERLYEALELAVKYFQASLVKNPTALEYVIKKRKLTKQTVKDFGIGYSPDSWNALTDFLRKRGFSVDELLRAGLAGQKSGRDNIYDLYRGRLMFPIYDPQGRCVGFTGRVLDDSLPKYLNTPQTVLYDKSRAIFGLHLAKEAIRTKDEVILVEGNMDVVASHQAGVKQVVAASGTALTLDQLKTLSHLTKKVKLSFDVDRAGMAATERAIPLAQKLGLNLYAVEIKDAKDPDELITTDVKLWEKAISGAKEIREYWYERSRLEYSIDDNPSGIDKIQFVKRMATILALYSGDEQQVFLKHMAGQTGIDASDFEAAIASSDEKFSPTRSSSPTSSANASAPIAASEDAPATRQSMPQQRLLETSFLALNLTTPEARLSLEDMSADDFESEQHQAIFAALSKRGRKATMADIVKDLPELADYVKILSLKGEEEYANVAPADRSFEAFTLAHTLRQLASKTSMKQLTKQLREAEASGDAQLIRSLLNEYQALIKEEK